MKIKDSHHLIYPKGAIKRQRAVHYALRTSTNEVRDIKKWQGEIGSNSAVVSVQVSYNCKQQSMSSESSMRLTVQSVL